MSDEKIALVFTKTTVAHVREVYGGFLSQCPEADAIARKFEGRAREKYEKYLSDDLTACILRERLDVAGALERIREDTSTRSRLR